MMPVTCSSVGRQARLPVRRRGSLTHGNRTHPRFPNTRPIANATESLREVQSNWTTTDSAEVYGFETWGAPYVTTDASTGRVVITPRGDDEFRGDDNNIDNNEHNESITIDLFALASDVRARLGSGGPLVVRFTDIALRQASELHGIFSNATGTWNYGSRYQGVFPVKCCHDAELLTALVMDGFRNKSGFGLEAGSKAELLLAIAVMTRVRKETTHQVMLLPETNTEVSLGRKKENKFGKHEQTPDPLLICNGYKDEKYVRLAFAAAASGVTTVLVLEKPSELETVMQVMRTSDDDTETTRTTPALGIRVRLGTTHDGQWGATSGDDAKFGLGAFEVLQAVSVLKKNDLLHKLTLLHFHVGSQVSDIATIKEAMREASQMYAELCRLGAPMGFIDVGGGLGVDYDGTKGGSGLGGGSSVNYDFSNYANDVVAALQDVVVRTGITPPVIVSESGRAVVSHSTVLVFEVVSTDNRGGTVETREGGGVFDDLSSFDLDRDGTDENALETAKNPKPLTLDELRVLPPSEFLLHNFREVLNGLRRENFLHATRGDDGLGNNTHKGLGNNPQKPNLQEAINDSKQFRLEADRLFKLGIMGLENRAEAEFLFSKCRARVFDIAKHEHNKNETRFLDLRSLQKQPSKWYHANVSVFRSLPDVWAIGQLFPVAPIHRLREVRNFPNHHTPPLRLPILVLEGTISPDCLRNTHYERLTLSAFIGPGTHHERGVRGSHLRQRRAHRRIRGGGESRDEPNVVATRIAIVCFAVAVALSAQTLLILPHVAPPYGGRAVPHRRVPSRRVPGKHGQRRAQLVRVARGGERDDD
jgi:arginine decarboxylase